MEFQLSAKVLSTTRARVESLEICPAKKLFEHFAWIVPSIWKPDADDDQLLLLKHQTYQMIELRAVLDTSTNQISL